VHSCESDIFHSTRLSRMFGCLEKHGIGPMHGMVEL
jgi:hypothetical protein